MVILWSSDTGRCLTSSPIGRINFLNVRLKLTWRLVGRQVLVELASQELDTRPEGWTWATRRGGSCLGADAVDLHLRDCDETTPMMKDTSPSLGRDNLLDRLRALMQHLKIVGALPLPVHTDI